MLVQTRIANNKLSSIQGTKMNCLPCIFYNILVTIDFKNFLTNLDAVSAVE